MQTGVLYVHASDFVTLMSHNFVCDQAITLKVSPTLVNDT